jgi:hypothetical protein
MFQATMGGQPTLMGDLEFFLGRHRAHGRFVPAVGRPTANGYRLEVACSCGMTWERWVLPEDAAVELALEQLRGEGTNRTGPRGGLATSPPAPHPRSAMGPPP